jgi:hypothetical protein
MCIKRGNGVCMAVLRYHVGCICVRDHTHIDCDYISNLKWQNGELAGPVHCERIEGSFESQAFG